MIAMMQYNKVARDTEHLKRNKKRSFHRRYNLQSQDKVEFLLPLLSFTIPMTIITDTEISFAAVITLIILNVTLGYTMITAMINTEI